MSSFALCLQDWTSTRQVRAAHCLLSFFSFCLLSLPGPAPPPSPSFLPSLFSLSLSLSLSFFLLHARHLTQTYPQYCWQFHDRLVRSSPGPLLQRGASPTGLGGEDSGVALVAFSALIYRVWGISAVLSRGILGYALCAFPGSFRFFSGTSTGQSQPYWGCGPLPARKGWTTSSKCIAIGIDYDDLMYGTSFCPISFRR